MRHNQGNGTVVFLRCSHCERKTAVNIEEEWEDTWWDGSVRKREGMPKFCPHCVNYQPFVEQANISLIEIFYEWGYRQWSCDQQNGWRFKIEVDP
jgi:hypothetical protein